MRWQSVVPGTGQCAEVECVPLGDGALSLLEYTQLGLASPPDGWDGDLAQVPTLISSVPHRGDLFVEVTYYASDDCSGQPRVMGYEVPEPMEASCVVNGVEYENYSALVPDPYGCGVCHCDQGALICERAAGCQEACPDGESPTANCARCQYDTGNCVSFETGCRKACVADEECEAGSHCRDGVCLKYCQMH